MSNWVYTGKDKWLDEIGGILTNCVGFIILNKYCPAHCRKEKGITSAAREIINIYVIICVGAEPTSHGAFSWGKAGFYVIPVNYVQPHPYFLFSFTFRPYVSRH